MERPARNQIDEGNPYAVSEQSQTVDELRLSPKTELQDVPLTGMQKISICCSGAFVFVGMVVVCVGVGLMVLMSLGNGPFQASVAAMVGAFGFILTLAATWVNCRHLTRAIRRKRLATLRRQELFQEYGASESP